MRQDKAGRSADAWLSGRVDASDCTSAPGTAGEVVRGPVMIMMAQPTEPRLAHHVLQQDSCTLTSTGLRQRQQARAAMHDWSK
jgi:hypothetical protein